MSELRTACSTPGIWALRVIAGLGAGIIVLPIVCVAGAVVVAGGVLLFPFAAVVQVAECIRMCCQ